MSRCGQRNRLFCRRICLSRATDFPGTLRSFANSPDDRLHQTIDTLAFGCAHFVKSKFGLAFFILSDKHRKLAAQVVFNERGLVPLPAQIPGIYPKSREITGLALGAPRASQKVLRFVAGRIADAVEFKPCNRPDVCGRSSIADR